ncbi:MAG: lipoyl synthase [Candidatus Thermoplasmatota archaeon]|jgi:lipoic acid synthetase|nr:lipoyl synthase [Candidatus Thermoplasmatota archaeon]
MRPDYVKVRLPTEESYFEVREEVRNFNLHTVCEEARCPNISECWTSGTATFMIMGKNCSRNCRFCSVTHGHTQPLDPDESINVANAVRDMKLRYVVITSVDRDDLPDGGSAHFANVIREVKKLGVKVEVLIPDFQGRKDQIENILAEKPAVIAHNVETVRRLTPFVRDHRATYDQSLNVLKFIGSRGFLTKSSIMVGLGESDDEVRETMRDLREAGVEILTVGQYLRPSRMQLPVTEYSSSERFRMFEDEGYKMGFSFVASGPLVRTSYRAAEAFALRRG